MDQTEKPVIGINIVNTVVFLILAVALVVGNFFLENSYGQEIQAEVQSFADFDYEKDNIIPTNGVLRFDPAFADSRMDVKLSAEKDYLLELKSGRVWGDLAVSNANLNILVNKVVLMPNYAAFNLSYDGTYIDLAVYGGDVYLGFLAEGVTISEPVDPYGGLFMNRILVPRGTQIRIAVKQITPEIGPLLYSKLAKELKLSTIADADRESEWVKNNMAKDLKFAEGLKQNYVSKVLRNGGAVGDGFWASAVLWSEKNLTFVPEKRENIVFDHLFDYLDAAIFYANTGEKDKVAASLAEFAAYRQALPVEVGESDDYYLKINQYIDELAVFGPTDLSYQVWEFLLEQKFVAKKNIYEIVNALWLDVYEAMDVSNEEAAVALDRYYRYFDRTVGISTDENFYRMYLTYQNQLFDNLLLRNSIFYKDIYFNIKDVFEQNLLNLYSEGQLKEELKQLFISNKIDLMKRLRKFFFDGEIDVMETKKIFDRLIAEVNKLMPPGDSGVAVVKLFQAQLADIIDFWGYLESAEYHGSIYGATHADRYQFYLREREIVRSVDDLLQNVLGEEVDEKTVEDVKLEVETIFLANVDVSSVEALEITNPDQRNVKVQGVIGGYPFEAIYDRYQNSLKEVYVYGELISSRAVKLDSLLTLLYAEFADLAEEVRAGDEEITMESIAQRIARKNITDTLISYEFIVEIEDVSVIDQLNVAYRVTEISLKDYSEVKVTFDLVVSGGEVVTNLLMVIGGTPRVFDGRYSITELVDMIRVEYDLYKNPPAIAEPESTSAEPTPEKISR